MKLPKKWIPLIIVLFTIMSIYLYFPNNFISPRTYFSDKHTESNIFIEFKEGGNINYSTTVNKIEVKNQKEIKDFHNLIQKLEFDINAPHRGVRDYSVYINFDNYHEDKYLIKMSKIDGGYVFFFKGGLYRNKELALIINQYLGIDTSPSTNR
ncbi:hypothetical protein ACFO3O_21295 [Dokdonia ponticola]|uniref:Uncharacterized protein n=1 Tax=Dokdonia ponticola TaxID=2041041 RepID=A0ABV9I406_9FLAO